MTFGHEGGYALNEDQRGGHDEAGAAYGAVRGILSRAHPCDKDLLKWLDRMWSEIQRLRAMQDKWYEQQQREGALQIRIENAVAELDHLADLLADSEELTVDQTPAVRLLNEILEALSGMPRTKDD